MTLPQKQQDQGVIDKQEIVQRKRSITTQDNTKPIKSESKNSHKTNSTGETTKPRQPVKSYEASKLQQTVNPKMSIDLQEVLQDRMSQLKHKYQKDRDSSLNTRAEESDEGLSIESEVDETPRQ